jgi:uncharacterized membrane protein
MNKIRLSTFIAGGIGLLDALYLSWSKLANQQVICGTYKGCETVNSSPYAEIGGIPIALLGAGAYIVILALLYMEGRGEFWQENGPLAIFVVSLAGTLYSAYLTYLEIAVIHAVCLYCVTSAIAMTVVFALTTLRLINPQAETNPI